MSFPWHYFEDEKEIENYPCTMILLVYPGVTETIIPLIILSHHDNTEDPELQC